MNKINKKQFIASLIGCALFVASACYLYSQFNYDFVNEPSDRRSEQAIVNAIYGFLVFGIPGLVFAFWTGFGISGVRCRKKHRRAW